MVDNQHQQITGYRDLTQEEVDVINEIKNLQAEVARMWRLAPSVAPDADPRDLAIARTHFQEGFSAFVRAIARPEDPFNA